jgi:hypothetical protein
MDVAKAQVTAVTATEQVMVAAVAAAQATAVTATEQVKVAAVATAAAAEHAKKKEEEEKLKAVSERRRLEEEERKVDTEPLSDIADNVPISPALTKEIQSLFPDATNATKALQDDPSETVEDVTKETTDTRKSNRLAANEDALHASKLRQERNLLVCELPANTILRNDVDVGIKSLVCPTNIPRSKMRRNSYRLLEVFT